MWWSKKCFLCPEPLDGSTAVVEYECITGKQTAQICDGCQETLDILSGMLERNTVRTKEVDDEPDAVGTGRLDQ